MGIIRLLAGLLLAAPLAANEAPVQVQGATTVDLIQAVHLKHHGALFVDVRSDEKWRWGHIAGAVHLRLDGDFADLERADIPRHLPLVIYCDSDLCESAPLAAALAVAWGYHRVFYFRGGYFAWQLADLPLAKGRPAGVSALSAAVP